MRSITTLCSTLLLVSILLTSIGAHARTVSVKYVGLVDLQAYQCEKITQSSFIRELCFDSGQNDVFVQLNNIWYRYCDMNDTMVNTWLSAHSMGRYYNRHVKGKKTC
ncbi:KTSC domain-containing protein [Granulosicoccus antarcticus]